MINPEQQLQENALKANFTEVQQAHFDRLMSELEVISDGLGFVEIKAKAEAGSKEALQVLRDYIAKKEQIVIFIETKKIFGEKEINWEGFKELKDYGTAGSNARTFKIPSSEMLVVTHDSESELTTFSVIQPEDNELYEITETDMTFVKDIIPIGPQEYFSIMDDLTLYYSSWSKKSYSSRWLGKDWDDPLKQLRHRKGVSISQDCLVLFGNKMNEVSRLNIADFSGKESVVTEGLEIADVTDAGRLNDSQVVFSDLLHQGDVVCVDKSNPKEKKWYSSISDDGIKASDVKELIQMVDRLACVNEEHVVAMVSWSFLDDIKINGIEEHFGLVLLDAQTGKEVNRIVYDVSNKFIDILVAPTGEVLTLSKDGVVEIFFIIENKLVKTSKCVKVGDGASTLSVMNDGKLVVTYKNGNTKIFGEK
ncbi:hypothetical protein HN858_05490 [Candidatus Falkowbacteria bacterium]|jgi:hypothetical protein|nr:hypothetical protein [Candidatus Falkowbacteria bacterium]MBT6573713.1 hypothetical protein [Candidatus Falkowbacteria bacterium]MBT7349089.1 hypothetical protein [Candidatus Falkowbacteria bacterium]MBT7500040.1 hypothetical protein [Candidatus Falkowbacteria bacterium]